MGSVMKLVNDMVLSERTSNISQNTLEMFCQCKENRKFGALFCFTCIQLHSELRVVHIPGVEKHFTYHTILREEHNVHTTPETNQYFFRASRLFHPSVSNTVINNSPKSSKHTWNKSKLDNPLLANKLTVTARCVLCRSPGNGHQPYLCQKCEQNGLM